MVLRNVTALWTRVCRNAAVVVAIVVNNIVVFIAAAAAILLYNACGEVVTSSVTRSRTVFMLPGNEVAILWTKDCWNAVIVLSFPRRHRLCC